MGHELTDMRDMLDRMQALTREWYNDRYEMRTKIKALESQVDRLSEDLAYSRDRNARLLQQNKRLVGLVGTIDEQAISDHDSLLKELQDQVFKLSACRFDMVQLHAYFLAQDWQGVTQTMQRILEAMGHSKLVNASYGPKEEN